MNDGKVASRPRFLRGFTLVEMLVVMAILAVLLGIAVAGIGFALRRSRNIARQAAATNLDRALEAFYSDKQIYPEHGDLDSFSDLVQSDSWLNPYLEGTWDAPPITTFGFTGSDGTRYTVCVSQEEPTSAGDFGYKCYGPGIGSSGYAEREYSPAEASTCGAPCGNITGCVNEDKNLVSGCCSQHTDICPS